MDPHELYSWPAADLIDLAEAHERLSAWLDERGPVSIPTGGANDFDAPLVGFIDSGLYDQSPYLDTVSSIDFVDPPDDRRSALPPTDERCDDDDAPIVENFMAHHGTLDAHIAASDVFRPDDDAELDAFAGISPESKVLAARVITEGHELAYSPVGPKNVASAWQWSRTHAYKPHVVNQSLAMARDFDTAQLIRRLLPAVVDGGTLPVVAAGNGAHALPDEPDGAHDERIEYGYFARSEGDVSEGHPLGVVLHQDDVLVVGAANADGAPTWFTNFGSPVDLIAPGAGLPTLRPKDICDLDKGMELFAGYGGTSGASPYTTGTLAMLIEANPYLAYEASRLREVLLGGCTRVDTNKDVGAGLLNADKALELAIDDFTERS